MEALEDRLQNDPNYAKFYNLINSTPPEERVGVIPCDGTNTITVPVAFHFAPGVVTCGDSDCLLAEVLDQLDALNIAFGNNTGTANEAVCPAAYQDAQGNSVASTGSCIDFCLAIPPEGNAQGLDPACDPPITIGEFTGGFGAGGNGAPGWNGIMNLFITPNNTCLGVADGIPGNANGDGVSTCATAFGGFDPSSGCGLDNDGTYNLGATMVHEIGHYLGLLHTHDDFGGSCTDYDVNPPGAPSPVNDTPTMYGQYYGCPTGCVTNAAVGGAGTPCANNVIPTANFMAYTDDACMSMFTEDQAAIMNYWANQLFGNSDSQCSDPNPTVLTSACENEACACPTMVTQPLALTEDACLIVGDYVLPTDLSAVASDLPGPFVWSTGNYLAAGGTAITGTTYTPTAPASCAPTTETLYLNLTCTGDPLQLDAGTLTLNVYPDPNNFAVTDLVAINDGDCNGPGVIITPGCEPYVTVIQNGGPTFPVTSGSGTVDYDVTLNYPAECCEIPGEEIILEGTIGSTTFDDASADQVCDPNDPNFATPAIWQITFNIPPAQNATDSNPTGLGSIKEVCIDLNLNGASSAIILSLDSPDCNAYEWENLWLGTDFNGGTNTGSTTLCFTTGTGNGDFDGTFDGDDGTSSSFMGCLINGNMWDFWLADYNCYLGNATGGTLNSATITFCDGFEPAITGFCDFTAQASYVCESGVPYCDDPCYTEYDTPDQTLCLTLVDCTMGASTMQACDDGDSCTENDMESVLDCDNTVVCVPCAGTPVAQCTLPSVAQACDDGDPCTENDMEEVDACDAAIVCVPCAGTAVAACSGTTTMVACDDGDPCTTGEMEEIDACDNTTVCVPCGNGMAVTAACGDPDATNYDMNATCIDNDVCTYGMYCDNPCYAEYAPNPGMNDTPDPALCVTALGCADLATIDPSCINTQACDDGDPCTENEEETIILADGSACGDCGLNATAVTAACGDPAANNYDMNATCIDNALCTYDGEYCDNPCYAEYNPNPAMGAMPNADLCVTALGCADLATIDPSCISTQTCDDGDPCTENEEETIILADGAICGDCGLNATTVTAACGDPAATNYDATATCIDNTLCVYGPCGDAITGNVSVDEPTCSIAGVQVIILDSSGMPVAGSPVTIDANGDYFLAGPFTCGNYTAELDLTTLPSCYNELEGETGPVGFTVDGDGEADGANFNNQAMVPTLSQWGLIILALLLMSFGAIKLGYLSTSFQVKRY